MPLKSVRWAIAPIALTLLAIPRPGRGEAIVVDPAMHHLGRQGEPEWREFASQPPEAARLETRFRASANASEATLLVRQRDVKLDWSVRLNGRAIGRLVLNEADLVSALSVPPGALRDGENLLEIVPPAGVDDIVVGELTLDPRPRASAYGGARLDVRVTDADSGRDLPCRLTLVDDRGVLMPVQADPAPGLAIRPGVAYTTTGRARLSVRPGRYTIHATRGFEYGLATQAVDLAEGAAAPVALAIRREVPTPGLVACDTHVHTLTHSGHGDASLEERLATLAGEGIELPVATDHDHLTDYAPVAERLGLGGMLTPVIGDEVTTRRGHFNAFPFAPGDAVPSSRPTHWPDLLGEIRKGAPDRLVILNHPRDLHAGFRPFDPAHYNTAVGEDRGGVPYGFDGVELVNSGAMQSDPMRVVRDWFALWNHGQEVTGVGASDSHDVSRFIVGQGRTYVACPDESPGRLDVAAACRSLRSGRAVVSLGLLARLTVNERFGPGELATGVAETIRVRVEVLGPSWTRADRVELYANGTKVRESALEQPAGAVEKGRVEWTLPRPAHDLALVAIASGPGVTAPYWPIPRPYQPTSRDWRPRVLSITNPVRVDADGDGSWSSARYYAQFVIEIFGTDPEALFPILTRYDEAVATQAAAFILPARREAWSPAYVRALESAPEVVRQGFGAYEESLSGPEPDRR